MIHPQSNKSLNSVLHTRRHKSTVKLAPPVTNTHKTANPKSVLKTVTVYFYHLPLQEGSKVYKKN